MSHLKALDKIASKNGNNRAFGFPGYAASVDYILSKTKKSKSWTVKTQDFPALFNKVESISLIIDDVDYYVYGLTYSPSTSAEGLTAPLVMGASGDIACTAAGYANLDVKGKIVLVQRGTCPDGTTLAGRMKPAAAAGAAAVIIYSNTISNVTAGTLSAPNPAYVPSGFINQVDGEALKARLDAREELEAYFQQTQTIETRITQNIFAESKGGDPENVIMLGAHLDSVQAGAGINDDGSGTTLILEIFNALQKFKFKNKIRLAWWGAEENGLVGSRYYTSNINSTTINSLLCYLNFDMVSRGYFGVFDGDGSTHNLTGPAGSDVIEKLFVDDLTSKGITVTPAVFTGGSDYASFMSVLGKPVGGLHTGTGVAQDDCYHQACDTYKNANSTVLTVNAKVCSLLLRY
jgi:Zn-dependent M28 family amino/carboxypeptidase